MCQQLVVGIGGKGWMFGGLDVLFPFIAHGLVVPYFESLCKLSVCTFGWWANVYWKWLSGWGCCWDILQTYGYWGIIRGHELASVIHLYVGFKLLDGCGMRVFCEYSGVPVRGMGCVHWRIKSTWVLVGRCLVCMHHLQWLVSIWCMLGGSLEVGANIILRFFIEAQTHFGMPRDANINLAHVWPSVIQSRLF